MDDQPERPNRPALSLHVPEPNARPGDEVDFSDIAIPPAGSVRRPDPHAPAGETHDLVTTLVRVLDEKDDAVGPWDPKLGCRHAAPDPSRHDAGADLRRPDVPRPAAGQDQLLHEIDGRGGGGGGRRPCSVPRRHVLSHLSPAGHPRSRATIRSSTMMCQIYSNRGDPLQGRQLPIMYSLEGARLLLHLRQSRDPVPAGGGLGDGVGDQGRQPHRRRLDRRRLDRRGRFPRRLHLRRRLSRAGHPQRRQQPVGDLELLRHRRRPS